MTVNVGASVAPGSYLLAVNGTRWVVDGEYDDFVGCQRDARFTLSASAVAAVAGGSGTSTVTVTPVNGFNGVVTLAGVGWPAGITGVFGAGTVT